MRDFSAGGFGIDPSVCHELQVELSAVADGFVDDLLKIVGRHFAPLAVFAKRNPTVD